MEVAGLVPRRDIGIAITATSLNGGAVNQPVAVALSITPSAPRDGPVDVDVLLEAWLPSDGTRKASAHVKVTVPASETAQEVLARLNLPSGRYQLRANATGTTGKSGTAYADFDVPDFAKDDLSLTSVIVGTARPPLGAGADPLNGLLPIVPTTTRIFGIGDRVTAAIQVSQGGLQPPVAIALTTRIVDEKGAIVSTATNTLPAERFRDKRTADHQFLLPSSALRPGKYLLTFEAAKPEAKPAKTTSRNVVFEVR
jgi:hypothetical protein